MLARQTFLNLVLLLALLSSVAVFSRCSERQEEPVSIEQAHKELRDELESRLVQILEAHPEVLSARVRLARLERCCFCDEQMYRAFQRGLYTCRVLLELAPGFRPSEAQARAWRADIVTLCEEVRLKPENCVLIDSSGRVLIPQ